MKIIKILFCLSLLFIVSSCGFKPMNQLEQKHNHILFKIKVNKINAEKSYLLRAKLEDALNPQHIINDQFLEINVIITKYLEDTLIQRDSTVARKNVVTLANFELKDLRKNKTLKTNDVRVITSFVEVDSPLASFYNEEKAYDDSTREVARLIKANTILTLQKNGYLISIDK